MKRKPTRPRPPLPKQLEVARQRFELWRSDPNRGRSIPDALWNRAVKLAVAYGVHKTARTLHVSYAHLKNRAVSTTKTRAPARSTSTKFLELLPVESTATRDCLIEFESRRGRKMRVELKSVNVDLLETLADSFWSDDDA
jgi:hypothetical protein